LKNEPWDVVKACKAWRKAGLQHLAVRFLHPCLYLPLFTQTSRFAASAWSTYAGSLRDLKFYEEAEPAALHALELGRYGNKDLYLSHCLIAAIYREMDQADKSQWHYEKAIELDPHHNGCASIMPGSTKASPEERQKVRNFLRSCHSPNS
jgi:tetratricopeptide (TPR) repeat protein